MDFINRVRDKIDLLYVGPSENFDNSQELDLKLISQSENADYVILNNIEEERKFSSNKIF